MRRIKGPAILLAQFAGDAPPFNSLPAIADWAAGLGVTGHATFSGARGVKFIAAAVDSSSKNGAWVDAQLAL